MPGLRSKPDIAALLWAVVVAVLLAHATWLWSSNRLAPDTDILAMLPVEERDPLLQQAIAHVSSSAQQRVVTLVGAPDWEQAQRAADAYRAVLAPHTDRLLFPEPLSPAGQGEWMAEFWRHRDALLTPAQRRELRDQPPAYWLDVAQRQLYSPPGAFKPGNWQDDPFGLFSAWAQERAQATPVRPSDGRLRVDADGRYYVVLPFELRDPAFSLSTQRLVMPLLEQAKQAATNAVPGAEVISTGVLLHAAAAGEQATREMSTIGAGSLVGILLLMWLAFRSLLPIGMVVLSLAVGCLGALSVCWLLFDRIHLLTLVFGASLVGVAEDYGIHYFCTRLARGPDRRPREILRELAPGMALALLTTVVAYLALALTPFPGLRQMAVFSGVGLVFAWLTVMCWFPLLDRRPLQSSRLMEWYGRSRAAWPQLGRHPGGLAVMVAALLFIAFGLSRLETNDDLRLLQNSPPELVAAQGRANALLATPSLGQFYLIRGPSEQAVLQREETLTARLDQLTRTGVLEGYHALSSWVPSRQRQQEDRDLVDATLMTAGAVLPALARQLGEDAQWATRLRSAHLQPRGQHTPATFLGTPSGAAWKHLWLGPVDDGFASVVTLRGVERHDLDALHAAAAHLDGVQWVDKVGDMSSLLGRYRHHMGLVVVLSTLSVFLLLFWRYRSAAWRVLAPTVAASALTVAAFGIIGQPLNLFHVLALLLILGMGVDYGIFLQEHPQREDRGAWFAIGLSAASTLLSFGLLGLSQTPALRSFGMTMLIGVATVWMIAPCFRADRITRKDISQ